LTPNLRFNKKITKKLLKSIPDTEDKLNPQTIIWNMENSNRVYGSWSKDIFGKTTIFMLYQFKPNLYRLVVSNEKGLTSLYLIDNIEDYLEFIGAQELELQNQDEIIKALDQTSVLPNTGIICIDEEKIFVYDHANY
jgi:hypothetical protein